MKPSGVVVVCPLQWIPNGISIGLTVATLTDCHLEDTEYGKYQLVFASAENVLEQILLQVNLRVQFFVVLKYRLRSNGRKKKNCQID